MIYFDWIIKKVNERRNANQRSSATRWHKNPSKFVPLILKKKKEKWTATKKKKHNDVLTWDCVWKLIYVALKITLLQMTEKEPCAKCFLCFYGHVLNYWNEKQYNGID